MSSQANSQCGVRTAQPTWCRVTDRHQAGDRVRTCFAEFLLLVWRERLQKSGYLPITGGDDDQSLVLRSSFELEQPLYCDAIVRIAAKAVTGFGGICDQSAASEVRGDAAK